VEDTDAACFFTTSIAGIDITK